MSQQRSDKGTCFSRSRHPLREALCEREIERKKERGREGGQLREGDGRRGERLWCLCGTFGFGKEILSFPNASIVFSVAAQSWDVVGESSLLRKVPD